MSTFGDYKSYKKYEPLYTDWKKNRDLMEAKRNAYLEMHPEFVNKEDVQRGQALLRAIDIMDEHSQRKAENMEAATEPVINAGLEVTSAVGMLLGGLLGTIKPIGRFFAKLVQKNNKNAKLISIGIPAGIGCILGTLAAFPLMAWGAKAEISASRKGRFEAMRGELKNPNGFAVLTDEQKEEAIRISETITLEEDKKKSFTKKITGGLSSLKDMAVDSKEYKTQQHEFEEELKNDEKNIDKAMSVKEIRDAKRDMQLLTKLIEQIDIASQDYAENSELAIQTAILGIGGLGGVVSIGLEKLLAAMNIKSARKVGVITRILSISAFAIIGIFAAQINKHASRVGRYKVKQELMKNPNNFIYVDDEKANTIENVEIKTSKKRNILSFLKEIWKDNKDYKKYVKTAGKEERKFFKALEEIELSDEQLNNAKKLQKNTFRTFNKIDDNSQKYAESVEAIGQSIAYFIDTIFSFIAAVVATPLLFKQTKTKLEKAHNITKYFGIVALSMIPAIIVRALITREQKKASRIADMKTIEELNDYRKFR